MNRSVGLLAGFFVLGGAAAGLAIGWGWGSGLVFGLGAVGLLTVVVRTAFPETTVTRPEGVAGALTMEIERARRFDHEFALVRLCVDGAHYRRHLAGELRLHLRQIDQVAVDAHGVCLVLAETGRAGAEQAARRLAAANVSGTPWRFQLAVYPADGQTSGALRAALQGRAIDRPVVGDGGLRRRPLAQQPPPRVLPPAPASTPTSAQAPASTSAQTSASVRAGSR